MSLISELEQKMVSEQRKKVISTTLSVVVLDKLDVISKMYKVPKNEIIELALVKYIELLKQEELKQGKGIMDFLKD